MTEKQFVKKVNKMAKENKFNFLMISDNRVSWNFVNGDEFPVEVVELIIQMASMNYGSYKVN